VFLFGFFLVSGVGYVAVSVRSALHDNLEFDARHGRASTLLGRRRPWYLSERKWRSIRETAVDGLIPSWRKKADFSSNEAYQVLKNDVPPFFTDTEWRRLHENAINAFEDDVIQSLRTSYRETDVLTILQLERPMHLNPNKWADLRREAHSRLFALKKEEVYLDPKGYVAVLRQERPQAVDADAWDRHLAKTRSKYFDLIVHEVNYSVADPYETLKRYDVSVLDTEERDRLQQITYKRAILFLPDLLNSEKAGIFLEQNRPAWINQEDYDTRRQLARQVVDTAIREAKCAERESSLERREKQIVAKKRKVSQMARRIAAQLRIVNEFLSDPSVLDRVEEYDNPFSPGNFANLRRVAALVKEDIIRDEENGSSTEGGPGVSPSITL
jgi:hypothetical protein